MEIWQFPAVGETIPAGTFPHGRKSKIFPHWVNSSHRHWSNQTLITLCVKKDIDHTRHSSHRTLTTPCVKKDIDHTRHSSHRTLITPCVKRTLITPDIDHPRHWSHRTLITPDIDHTDTVCKKDIDHTRHWSYRTFITPCVKKDIDHTRLRRIYHFERPKRAKDKVKNVRKAKNRPEGPPTRNLDL